VKASFLSIAATLASCLVNCNVASAQTKITIAIGSTVFDVSQAGNTSIPYHLKCWEKEGVTVELQPTTASAALQALIAGKVEMVNFGPATAVIARAKGVPIKAVYLNIRRNFVFPVVLETSPIKSLADFKGKTVGVFSYAAQQYKMFKAMVLHAGVDPEKDVTWIETGAGAQAVTALRAGRVDAWGTWDSQIATAENMGLALRRFTSPATEKLNWGSSYFVRDDYAKSNPETVGKVLRCLAKSALFVTANPEATVRAHWAMYPETKPTNVSDAEAMRQALHILRERSEYLKLEPGAKWGEMPAGTAEAMVEFMKKSGELTGTVNPADLYTNDFVKATNDFDQTKFEAEAKAAK